MKIHLIRKAVTLVILTFLLSFSMVTHAQEKPLPDTLTLNDEAGIGLFESDETMDVSIKFDITEYTRKKPDEYMDAVITFYNDADDSISYDIRLRSRGERRRELCAFPPIRLNFKDTETIYGDIDSITNIKMVTHCNTQRSYDDYLLKEYLVYKLYNLITDYSFRVRLLRIKYIDTGKRGKNDSKYGFLIEPMDLLERRLGVFQITNLNLKYRDMIPDMLDRMAIFQFMVGNTDWQVISNHNIKIVKDPNQRLAVPIAYDFDYSGIVNTAYSVPAPITDITDVTQRYFMGACREDSTYLRILGEFMNKKDDFFEVIENFDLLGQKSKKFVTGYLEGFFDLYRRDNIIYLLKRTCDDR
jgi:hypothetical protein